MYDFTIYNFLKSRISPCKLTIRKDETIIRCPFCGDSIHDKFDAHFYINNIPPFKFFCQKCNVSGYFNKNILNDMFKLYDGDISEYLEVSFNDYKRKMSIKYGESYNNYFNHQKEISVLPKKIGLLEKRKIEYFENRMGIILDEKDLEKYQIILNIYDFFDNNDINYKKFNKNIQNKINEIYKTHIMFLLYDKNMICCRNTTNNGERYYNLNLFETNNEGFSKKFYSIKNDISYYNSEFNINISEGIFDILGVFNHIYNKKMNDNDIFLAANGKGFKFVLNYMMKLGFLNCNINIYSDKDVNKNYYEKFKNGLLLTKYNGMNIYYNNEKGQKDFGVKKENIKIDVPYII